MSTPKKTTKKALNLSQKIQEARETIKAFPVKKDGRNTFSKYDYFTPEKINRMVSEACKKVGLITFYNLDRTEFGLTASLTVKDIETEKAEVFTMAMEIPSIKATNVAQQLGGAMTYSKRYLEMAAFDIVENSLDFDTTENTQKNSAPVTRAADSSPKRKHTAVKSPDTHHSVAPEAKKVDKSGKTMNAATAKYFESKCGTLPLDKLRAALLDYNTSDGYGLIVQTMLDNEEAAQSKKAKK